MANTLEGSRSPSRGGWGSSRPDASALLAPLGSPPTARPRCGSRPRCPRAVVGGLLRDRPGRRGPTRWSCPATTASRPYSTGRLSSTRVR